VSWLYPEFSILFLGLLFLYVQRKVPKVLLLVLFLMIVALLRPVLKERLHTSKESGVNAAIALDLSFSMRAKDILPSRLEAAKETIKKIVHENRKNRFALYAFTTNPLILSAPTSDADLPEDALDALKVENILTHGTSLSKLFAHFTKKHYPLQTLVLFTDGGEERDLKKLSTLLGKSGLRLIVVGMATRKGSLLYDNYDKVLKDREGALVITRLNPLLEKLAAENDGVFIPFETPQTTAQEVLNQIDAFSEKTLFQKKRYSYVELFWIPLVVALVLFFFHFVRLPKKVLLMIPFLSLPSQSGVLDWYYLHQSKTAYEKGAYQKALQALEEISSKTLQSEFDKALLYYKTGEYRKAQTILSSLATKDPQLKFKILFLEGNTYVRQKKYQKARIAYQQALILKKDPAVLENLRLILGKVEQSQPKPPVYQKKESRKVAFASKTQKPKKQKERAGKTKNSRTKVTRPLGYKAYELINEGYIHEKKPW